MFINMQHKSHVVIFIPHIDVIMLHVNIIMMHVNIMIMLHVDLVYLA